MNWLKSVLKVLGPRVIASAIGGIATYIGVKTSGAVNVDPAKAAEVVTTILLSYAGAHKAVSAVTNPGDAATARVGDAIKDAASLGTTVRIDPKF